MMNIKKGCLWVINRRITFFIFLFLLTYVLVDYNAVKIGYRLATLYYNRPAAFDYLINFVEKKEEYKEHKFREYANYYEKVVDYISNSAGGYGMLGYCYYHLGETERAVDAFKRAIFYNQNFFWFAYNLGLIRFKEGHYREAVMIFKRAVRMDPNVTLRLMESSEMIYQPLIRNQHLTGKDLTLSLKESFKISHHLILQGDYLLEDFEALLNDAQVALITQVDDTGLFYYYAGLGAYQLARYKEAATYFQKRVQYDSGDGQAFFLLGLSYQSLGLEELSDQNLKKAKELGIGRESAILKPENYDLKAF